MKKKACGFLENRSPKQLNSQHSSHSTLHMLGSSAIHPLSVPSCCHCLIPNNSSIATSPGRLPSTADPCTPNPCQNRALCRSRGNGYACFCVPGFQGARCQIDVNECISRPCLNGATCVDGVGRFTCLCPPGVTGESPGPLLTLHPMMSHMSHTPPIVLKQSRFPNLCFQGDSDLD